MIYKLKDLLEIKNGKDYRLLKQGEIPVYGTGGIIGYVNQHIYDGESVLLPRKGSLSNIMYVNGKFWTIDTIYWTVVKDKVVLPLFLFYYLSLLDITKKDSGSTLPSLTFNAYYTLDINVPNMEFQNKIVKIIKLIDDKIDLNNRIVKKLESMMKEIYDYWFVQFDFPNEKGKPYKSSGGKMVYNEKLKREIPQNFKYVDIGNIEKNIITGKTPPTINIENYNGAIPFITISDIRNSIFVYETEQTLSEIGANTQNNKFLPVGSLCVSCIASIGEIGFTTKISKTNQQINSIIFEKEYNKEFFYFVLKDYFRKSYVAKTGNTFKNMNKHDFSQIKILYSEELVKCFHNAVKAYMDKIRVLYKQNSKLKHYKNFILPLLMNGQVEVK